MDLSRAVVSCQVPQRKEGLVLEAVCADSKAEARAGNPGATKLSITTFEL